VALRRTQANGEQLRQRHIHFVHRNTFGDINNPDPPEPTIERLDYGFVARSDMPVYNTELQKKNLGDDGASPSGISRRTGICRSCAACTSAIPTASITSSSPPPRR